MRSARTPTGSPHGRAWGFNRFIDRLLLHGLEFLNLYYGVYRAQVMSNTDDDNQGRIRIRCPAVGDTPDTPPRLAYPIFPLAGQNHGMKFIPPEETYCYVVFENGRVDTPLWIGGWFARDDIPSDLAHVDQHWILTPGGHRLVFDDRSDSSQVQLQHSTGAEVLIDKDGNVSISNASGQTVTAGSGQNEAAALGDTLKSLLEQLIDAITAMTVGTSTGPSSVPTNAAQFIAIKAQLQRILSNTVKLAK